MKKTAAMAGSPSCGPSRKHIAWTHRHRKDASFDATHANRPLEADGGPRGVVVLRGPSTQAQQRGVKRKQ